MAQVTDDMRCEGPRRRLLVGLALAGLGLAAAPARAEASARDLKTIARALAFIEPAPTGALELGLVYPAASPAGRAEAERAATAMGSGLRAGSLVLRPKLVTIEEAALAGLAALLLTTAALPQAGQIAASLAGRGILTVATDPAAVGSGNVVMSVRSEPRVEILVSRAAARTANIGFSAAFRMMIQER